MQANEFEKNVQNKLEKLELVPHTEVWKQVLARIGKEKRKRRILFFWIFGAFVMLTGAAGYLFIIKENNKKPMLNEMINNYKKKENHKTKQNTQNSLQRAKKVQKILLKEGTAYVKKHKIKSIKILSEPKEKTIDLAKIRQREATTSQPKFTASQPSLSAQQKNYKTIYKKEEKYAQKDLIPHKYYNPNAAPAKIVKDSTDGKINDRKDTSANKTATKTVRVDGIKSKKWQTGFTVYSGISDNVSSFLSMDKIYSPGSLSSPAGANGNYNYDSNLLNSFKRAFSFGIGVFVKKQLIKRIGFSAGVDYHFYSAKSAVGKRVNSPAAFYDSESQLNVISQRYYTPGDSVTYSNHYHLLELPINLLLQFTKNTNKSLLLTAGVSPGYLIGSNALYANPSANVYYADKQKLHRFQLSAQSSLLFPVVNSSDFTLHAGPAIQYGLTNTSKSATDGRQHLFFAGIKANIIFR